MAKKQTNNPVPCKYCGEVWQLFTKTRKVKAAIKLKGGLCGVCRKYFNGREFVEFESDLDRYEEMILSYLKEEDRRGSEVLTEFICWHLLLNF